MKVLIIEDDPVTSLILRHLLTERGYDVTACGTAEEAMKICREAVFPLLFMDLYLPGMDGFSFCRWLRNQPAGDPGRYRQRSDRRFAEDSRGWR